MSRESLPEGWSTKTLGDFVSLRRGHDLTDRDRNSGAVPVFGAGGQNGFHDEALVQGPGVVLGRSGASFGQAYLVTEDFWPHNTALYVTSFHENDTRFAYYFLDYYDFSSHNSGGAQQSLNRNFIAPLPIHIPPLVEQEAIASALSDADALIESLEQLLAKKRQIKQGAMQELLTGRRRLIKTGEKQSTRQTTIMGEVPSDWSLSTVGEEFNIKLGKMIDADKNSGVAKQYLGNRSIQWNRIDTTDLPTVDMSHDDLAKYRLQYGDLLVCEGGDVGRAAVWESPLIECYFQKALHRLRAKHGFDHYLMIAFLQQWSFQGKLQNFVTQTSIAHLPKDKFELIPLAVPSPEEQHAIMTVLNDLERDVIVVEKRLAKARQLKQAMMQQLLTGRIRLI